MGTEIANKNDSYFALGSDQLMFIAFFCCHDIYYQHALVQEYSNVVIFVLWVDYQNHGLEYIFLISNGAKFIDYKKYKADICLTKSHTLDIKWSAPYDLG